MLLKAFSPSSFLRPDRWSRPSAAVQEMPQPLLRKPDLRWPVAAPVAMPSRAPEWQDRGQLRLMFEQAPGFMALLRGPDHVFELANPAFRALVGGRDLIGKKPREALPEMAEQGHLQLLDDTYRLKKAFVAAGMRVALNNEAGGTPSVRYLDFVYQPMVEDDGAVSGVWVLGHDVTVQTLAAIALSDASREKDAFLATLAHELRNPLAPIANVAAVLGQLGTADEKLRRMAGVLQRQAVHMTRLIDDLLDTSRVGQGLLRVDLGTVDMREVVSLAVEQVSGPMKAQGHALQLELPDAPMLVRGDAARLVQVLANMLHNAAKYTPPGGQVRLLAAVEDRLRIEVRDNGAGIAPEFLPLLFHRFQQAARPAGRAGHGLGLGLALVRSLVELHGGTVDAASAGLGLGSTFTVRLPLLTEVS